MKIRRLLLFLVFCGFVVILSACGEKSQEKVTDQLKKTVEDLDSYKATAEMKMKTGQDDQSYDIEVWHKKDNFYRVQLMNHDEDQESQIILRNEEGVFVLTPELEKRFKFQTEWPDNNGQAYLFHSLVNDILQDSDATFEATDDYYVFETKANYKSNQQMPQQEIYFDKKSLTPIMVKVLDQDHNPAVEVSFTNFELNSELTADDFDIERNMEDQLADEGNEVADDSNNEGEEASDPTNEQEDEETENKNSMNEDLEEEAEDENSMNENLDEENTENEDPQAEDKFTPGDDVFEVLFPLETFGASLTEQEEVKLEDGSRVLMVFTGDKNFTLIQEQKETEPALSAPREVEGDIVNLGFAVGALSDHSIEWSVNGIDYYLASEELTEEELVAVAQSVQGKEAK